MICASLCVQCYAIYIGSSGDSDFWINNRVFPKIDTICREIGQSADSHQIPSKICVDVLYCVVEGMFGSAWLVVSAPPISSSLVREREALSVLDLLTHQGPFCPPGGGG